MATTFLKRSHAVVWLPPRAVGERALATEARLIVQRPGGADVQTKAERASLDSMPKVRSVTLVFDARDVNLFRPKVPALSGAKLAKALPNLVEDALLQDAASCAFACGSARPDGHRLVAVIDRGWLEFVIGAFERRGMSVAAAWPAQLALPYSPGSLSIACLHQGIAVRTGEESGLGWSASVDVDFRTEALVAAIQAARAGSPAPGMAIVYLDDPAWRVSVERACEREGLRASLAGLPEARRAPIELLDGRAGTAGRRWLAKVDWRAWRLPAALAAACVLVGLLGLNLMWGQMIQQRAELKSTMERRFRQAFPNAQVVVDPLLQMQRQVAGLRGRAGQSGPDDFVPMLSRFAQALGPQGTDALVGVEFREGQLKVRFQPAVVESSAARDAFRDACSRRGLALSFDKDSPAVATVRLAS